MKRIYQAPKCQALLLADEDVLTSSSTTDYVEANKNSGQGDYNGGGIANW